VIGPSSPWADQDRANASVAVPRTIVHATTALPCVSTATLVGRSADTALAMATIGPR
jgi:hypothetical protein